jgi:hypothetical protein
MEPIDWRKEFPITSICREDLKELGFTDEQIALLTDQRYVGYCQQNG